MKNTKTAPTSVSFKHTIHSEKRSSQRGISNTDIELVMSCGEVIQKQGLCYIIAKKDNFPAAVSHEKVEKLKKLVLIADGDSNCLITCYRNKKSFRYIRKKRKELSKSYIYINSLLNIA